jgi:TatD DNase family protein
VNASYLIPLTLSVMAEVRQADLGELCDSLWDNTMRAFGEW